MILRAYGGNESIFKLRTLTQTSKIGTNAYALIEGAKKVGLKGRGFRCEDLAKINSFPCIAHVILDNNFQHYVVIRKINFQQGLITISDPAQGNQKIKITDFMQMWTKVIITFEPMGKITKVNHNREIITFLINLIKPHTKKIVLVVFLSLFVIVLNIINALYLKIIVEQTFKSYASLVNLFIVFMVVALLKIIADYMRKRLLIRINRKVDMLLMMDTYKRLLSLPYNCFSTRATGDIMARINDLSYVSELVSRASIVLLVDFFLVISALTMLLSLNMLLFLIVLLMLVSYLLVVIIYSPKIKEFIRKSQMKKGVFYTALVESINGIETIRNLGFKGAMTERIESKYSDLLKNNYNFENLINRQGVLKDFIVCFLFNLVLYLGSLFNLYGSLSVGEIILFNSLLLYFMEPIKSIFDAEPLFRSAWQALIRVLALTTVKGVHYNGQRLELGGGLQACNLSYSYDGFHFVLEKLNFTIKPQCKVLVTGDSGSGKSTFAKILSGHYCVKKGCLQIGGFDINEYSLVAFRDHVCYVGQNECLFSASILYNLDLGRGLGAEKIDEIKRLTGIDVMLEEKQGDDNFMITENGLNLSGGERQRIILGRSLLKDANIYILDECTNAMNADLERMVLSKVFKHFHDKTIIVISHRLNNRDLFDQIINFSRSKERG